MLRAAQPESGGQDVGDETMIMSAVDSSLFS